jgi:Na+-translocating ferredoxin:NAD+ oxidoreductase RnfA subunit
MPTDLVELCVAACCIVSMALVRGTTLAPRDGLDRKARAVATGMASTLLLAIANCVAYLLNAAVLPAVPLPPSTSAVIEPLVVVIVSAIVVVLAISIAKQIYSALHRLLGSLAPAIAVSTPLLAAITALMAPAQNTFHAALTAVGAGFGFTLLLQLCVVLATRFDTLSVNSKKPLPTVLQHITENSAASTLLLAGLLAMLLASLNVVR